jgi:HD superfamily phosphodiesterase
MMQLHKNGPGSSYLCRHSSSKQDMSQSKQENGKRSAQPEADARLDAIKEIIFGQQIREYEQTFSALRDELKAQDEQARQELGQSQEYLLQRIEQLQRELTDKMNTQQEKLLQEIARLKDQKADRVALGKMLIQIGTKLSG